jgi:hypothetical protein
VEDEAGSPCVPETGNHRHALYLPYIIRDTNLREVQQSTTFYLFMEVRDLILGIIVLSPLL